MFWLEPEWTRALDEINGDSCSASRMLVAQESELEAVRVPNRLIARESGATFFSRIELKSASTKPRVGTTRTGARSGWIHAMNESTPSSLEKRIHNAWSGRISGCQLGKPVERLSMQDGYAALQTYLSRAAAVPLRDYVPWSDHPLVQRECCRAFLQRSEPDDDINYSVLALMMLEEKGVDLTTVDVARFWLRWLPAASTFTAERAAYRTLLQHGAEWFAEGAQPGFDLALCSDNRYNDWIGAQIRTDVYGWVFPGDPLRAAELARQDASLSHRGDGVFGAVFVAALGAALADRTPAAALQIALGFLPGDSGAADAVRLGFSLAGREDGGAAIRQTYKDLSPVHTLNNLAIVVWALYSHLDDFGAAIGDAVSAGLDTDCNGATVGGLWGLQGDSIPEQWTSPWQGRVGVSLAGMSELNLESLIGRTIVVADRLRVR